MQQRYSRVFAWDARIFAYLATARDCERLRSVADESAVDLVTFFRQWFSRARRPRHTVRDFVDRTGIDTSRLFRIRHGDVFPEPHEVAAIAAEVGVDPETVEAMAQRAFADPLLLFAQQAETMSALAKELDAEAKRTARMARKLAR